MSSFTRLLCGVLLLLSSIASADDATSAARDHYKRGSSLFDLGRFGEAAHEFEAAYEAKNDPALLYNLGQAYRADGQYAKALVAYKAFLRKSNDASRRPDVEARITELQQLLEQQKSASSKPPTGTIPPEDVKKATTASPAPAPAPALVVATPPERHETPVYKRWWLWTIVGVAAAGAATGIAVALTTPKDASIPSGATAVTFH